MKIDKKKKLTKVKNSGKFEEEVLHEFPCESKSLYMAGYTYNKYNFMKKH